LANQITEAALLATAVSAGPPRDGEIGALRK